MPENRPVMLGQPIQVPAGLEGTCMPCCEQGQPGYGELVTTGTEIADVVEEMDDSGWHAVPTGLAAVLLECPDCGYPVQFTLPGVEL